MTYCKAISCYKERNGCYYTDYCSYHRNCLDKLFEKNSSIKYSNVRKLDTFETYFNKNCGYLIVENPSDSSDCPFYIWIVVYEPAVRGMSEEMSAIEYNTHYLNPGRASEVARGLKSKLQNNDFHATPMLYVYTSADYYKYFSDIITSPYVIKKVVFSNSIGAFASAPADAERYFKPLDIVWVKRRHITGVPFYHVGIYLGKGGKKWVCHLDDDKGVKITDWESFLGSALIICEELIRYHPIIPFKYYKKIAKQIGATWDVNWRNGSYDLTNRNCEHYANMIVYGINYSKQIYDKISRGNNDKGSTIKLVNEMSESNDKLGWKTNDWSKWIERRCEQEVPTKKECKIM